jgi:hypothetical protein
MRAVKKMKLPAQHVARLNGHYLSRNYFLIMLLPTLYESVIINKGALKFLCFTLY